MKTELFDYDLPQKLIAQYPVSRRGESKLLVLDRKNKTINHKKYSDLPEYVQEGDVVILNRTKVLQARIFPRIRRSGRQIELLFLKEEEDGIWECLIGGARKVKGDDVLHIGDYQIQVISRKGKSAIFVVQCDRARELMEKLGHVPLPPYIKREDEDLDKDRYNTVFSRKLGSVAAPTASLNLTENIISRINAAGGKIGYVNLEVSWGTFAPVNTKEIEDFDLHCEHIDVPLDTAELVNSCERYVYAFGTTVCRALESAVKEGGKVSNFSDETDLFIYPGYEFQVVDRLVTNFHAPKSSLIMLVSAFAGRELILHAYEVAKQSGYKFLSYGDSMLIV